MLQALQGIENRPGSMPPTQVRDSHGHRVPNIRWSTQFAQIAGGRYDAGAEPTSTSPSSHRRLPNVYGELGTTMASVIVTFPTVWGADLIPNDNFTRLKAQRAEVGAGRSDTRLGWRRI